ncbi:MAG: NIPSNAP family protein [Chloroflexales bacterium]|nr:NIPSNAP family protein [Chloroflexales bacterium]
MIYELRTYWAAPGKLDALHERFRSLTLRIFVRHQMQVVGFWTPQPSDETSGDLVYLLTFPSVEALEQAWTAFRADPEWQAGKAASEAAGALVTKLTSRTLVPTNYSPLV